MFSIRNGLLGLLALTTLGGIGIPMVAATGPGGNEGEKLAEATERASNKANALDRSYNDIVPAARPGTEAAEAEEGEGNGKESAPQPPPGYGLEHPVMEAMNLMHEIHQEFGPRDTEYTRAVNVLKSTWDPRYQRAMEEYERFERRVVHARNMAYRYMETQQRLTESYKNEDIRRTQERRDYYEQKAILEWVAGAEEVLGQARAIRDNLTDMNTTIVKLELSANFKSVYQDFAQIPLSMTLLNEELEDFETSSDLIYEQFGETP